MLSDKIYMKPGCAFYSYLPLSTLLSTAHALHLRPTIIYTLYPTPYTLYPTPTPYKPTPIPTPYTPYPITPSTRLDFYLGSLLSLSHKTKLSFGFLRILKKSQLVFISRNKGSISVTLILIIIMQFWSLP